MQAPPLTSASATIVRVWRKHREKRPEQEDNTTAVPDNAVIINV